MELQNKENNDEKHIEKPTGKTPATLVNDQVSNYLKVKEISIDLEVQININLIFQSEGFQTTFWKRTLGFRVYASSPTWSENNAWEP